ncbi:hypothetical protein BGW36DRAFT_370873 [Talaromyces proteolyticus]|uniref:CMP/dCMP-type deaminase domain-containing protein n=1 Tax=Talaromyces proteolyticus TaxID=1131652 RepID=A0AAD4L227_9EURO|nr:uncharacterized protein BGW36DRAFT_370873 [Talaromyces proteolyticus]KAH8704206.1 hypothetical protein BGW36DRAFT_370873 [Talaromyces proteolyticus]
MADDTLPLQGHIIPVRTVQETNPNFEFAKAYVVEIIQKYASQVIKVLDTAYPKDPNQPLTHIRRFVKADFLPDHLKTLVGRQDTSDRLIDVPTIFVLIPPPVSDIDQLRALITPFVPARRLTRSINATGTGEEKEPTIPHDANENTAIETPSTFPILHTSIPIHPALSIQQAETWSRTNWPTSYNAAAARAIIAPPPKTLTDIQADIAPNAGLYLGLARSVAREAKALGRGRGIGVVVVDHAMTSATGDMNIRNANARHGVVAVAGDARYCARGIDKNALKGDGSYQAECEGGPEFHAIMRAVEMIAGQRRGDGEVSTDSIDSGRTITHTTPALTPLESHYLKKMREVTSPPAPVESTPLAEAAAGILPRSAGGYLCTDLDMYITHEPCLTCSMAMLLSRFRAITFPRRGRLVTGGLASEPVPGLETGERENYYGLHWRKELNWRAVCFEFVEDMDDGRPGFLQDDGVEAVGEYHA